jgi:5-methylcytosine-specific restriction endonuclease McrA
MNTTLLSRTAALADAARLSNQDLITRVKELARTEREATAVLIAHLAVLEERELHLAEGCSSFYTYCTQVLHLSEYAAYGRIQAARAARRFPLILEMLSAGAVNLTTVILLAPHLTSANHCAVLEAATHKSKRKVEELVVQLRPRPAVPSIVRKLPSLSLTVTSVMPPSAGSSRPAGVAAAAGDALALESGTTTSLPTRRPIVEPLAPQQYRVQFTASAETYEKLRLAQDLLRYQIPDGDVGRIMDRALSVLVETLAKQKFAATNRPQPLDRSSTDEREQNNPDHGNAQEKRREGSERHQIRKRFEEHRGEKGRSRHIPAEVKRKVWLRDGGRCTFVAPNGRRCTERGFLEFHHVEPYSVGGEATVENIELRCRAHNGYEAELFLGRHEPLAVREASAVFAGSPRSNERVNLVQTQFTVNRGLATSGHRCTADAMWNSPNTEASAPTVFRT